MKKFIVFDVEGTIFKAEYRIDGTEYASTMWQPLAKSLDAVEEERLTHVRWEKGGYKNYSDWVDATYYIHKKHSLKKDVFDTLIENAEYAKGVREFFNNLDRNKYRPVLISGGFHELVKRAQMELRIDDGQGACEYFFTPEEGVLASRTIVSCDWEGKYEYLKILFDKYQIDLNSEWIFVGDGKNDVAIAKKATISFSVGEQAHEDLKKEATHSVDNFYQIAEIINRKEKDTNAKLPELETLFLPKRKNGGGRRKIRLKGDEYTALPKLVLANALNDFKAVFVGLKQDYSLFRYLEGYHENLVVISAEEENTKFSQFTDVDILFIFKDCVGHPLGEKARKEINAPSVLLKHHKNKDLLTTALSNIIYRELFIKK